MAHQVLMSNEEPSDLQLSELMHEVACEAHQRAIREKQHLSERIAQEIALVRAKMKRK